MENARVAVVAVHGVADQDRGDTVESVAVLLASQCAGNVQRGERVLPVRHLPASEAHTTQPANGLIARIRRSRKQSLRSDFVVSVRERFVENKPTSFDVGALFTDYLLAKAAEERPRAQRVEHAPFAIRQVDGVDVKADLYEMYWADLSRVQSGILRILSELATLLFRFARLGTEAQNVGAVLVQPRSGLFRTVAVVQRYAEWVLSRLLAPAALQLVLCVLLYGAARLVEHDPEQAKLGTAFVVGVATAAVLVYYRGLRWFNSLLVGVAGGFLPGVIARWLDPASATMLMLLLALSGVYLSLASYWEKRFRAAFTTSLVLYAGTLSFVIGAAYLRHVDASVRWTNAVVTAAELQAVVSFGLWLVEALLLSITSALSSLTWALHRENDDVQRVIVTARLALFTSVGAFLVTNIAAFALVDRVLSDDLKKVAYDPLVVANCSAYVCTAADFVHGQIVRAGTVVPLLAGLLLSLVGAVVLAFAPSVFLEMRALDELNRSRLGTWLTRGYAALERLIVVWGLLLFVGALWAVYSYIPAFPHPQWLTDVNAYLQTRASSWIATLLKIVAVNSAGLLALGKVTVNNIKALRAPLDAALDVDNHFREFPRHGISRVLILERYLALLEHLRVQQYTRVVLVAHSQGSVITADLLRYLRQRPDGQLKSWLASVDVRLLTVGSPLRQLYALRFPRTYSWVEGEPEPGLEGPKPSELGLTSWWNLWASGDYVGRWLWTERVGKGGPFEVARERYTGAPRRGSDGAAEWRDLCIGADAHTHYFDLDKRVVAEHLTELVR